MPLSIHCSRLGQIPSAGGSSNSTMFLSRYWGWNWAVFIWTDCWTSGTQWKAQPFFEALESLKTPYTISPAAQTLAQLKQQTPSAQALQHQLDHYQLSQDCFSSLGRSQISTPYVFVQIQPVQVYVFNTGFQIRHSHLFSLEELSVRLYKKHSLWSSTCQNLWPKPVQKFMCHASARTYTVKKGQWIQIIDVSGKQCSDFLAFDQHALAQGVEIGLDAVATRTVLGRRTQTWITFSFLWYRHAKPSRSSTRYCRTPWYVFNCLQP